MAGYIAIRCRANRHVMTSEWIGDTSLLRFRGRAFRYITTYTQVEVSTSKSFASRARSCHVLRRNSMFLLSVWVCWYGSRTGDCQSRRVERQNSDSPLTDPLRIAKGRRALPARRAHTILDSIALRVSAALVGTVASTFSPAPAWPARRVLAIKAEALEQGEPVFEAFAPNRSIGLRQAGAVGFARSVRRPRIPPLRWTAPTTSEKPLTESRIAASVPL